MHQFRKLIGFIKDEAKLQASQLTLITTVISTRLLSLVVWLVSQGFLFFQETAVNTQEEVPGLEDWRTEDFPDCKLEHTQNTLTHTH